MPKSLVALVGTKYHGPEMVQLLASLPQGEQLTLIREPNNKFDSAAIQVWARGFHIGYVKSSQNKALARAMDAGANSAGAFPAMAKLAIDGGTQPMIEIED